ncbi:hypothetical protein A2715_04950 [Candidatus Woesebacteria bacterium RIFCSPHIGHO2_01_FULL_39_32]|uniref:Methyltransferase type 11 domain-containing protein n=1 Tax=Candidatus Woesebacteria bacterium RIFCSPLOWO2_01_FULL_39_25 TaxID=1802521 RepID=A0A1F8BNN2_9BACT|nr:MAG: hypothetical protein A2124_00765 [Candidatus Woesebacteria bacterium GWB1_37_5]OGM25367.1 MAG: hypothetical protein A2715_04950 [Candidatus Woesebacteria bacterium RIFCSPHIGHO2_01_FULL_39_32]OGM38475.1 MAG: hypothetical protein A3F01_03905 [Candidatus Woesebacteria bacterium RIFCSPHIGHO2_12_FULL_38_11]OGM64898.1 MAG: hypothetical protein A2893_04560 [Candidatus Woesebacteria bacterium RIFCSPLOWO2_01_FULL_39_25]
MRSSEIYSKKKVNNISRILENVGDIALRKRAEWLINNLHLKKGEKALDVGCGDGFYLHILSKLKINLKLYGIDNDKKALITVAARFKKKEVKLFWCDLMRKLPYKSNSFDKVIMSEVLEHLQDDKVGLKEVYRVLKPNGILCLSVPNHRYPFLWDPVNWTLEHMLKTHLKSGFWAGIWNQHIRLYEKRELKEIVKNAGFKVRKIQSLTQWSLPFNHYLVNLGARLLTKKSFNVVTSGANKFEENVKRSFTVNTFFAISNLIDRLNSSKELEVGVSLVVSAKK